MKFLVRAGLLAASLQVQQHQAQQPREHKEEDKEQSVTCFCFSREQVLDDITPHWIYVNAQKDESTERTFTGPSCQKPDSAKYKDFLLIAVVPPDKVEFISEKDSDKK